MKKFKMISVMIITICFTCLSLITIFKEKDTYSDSERRVLASFPEVSLDRILNGSFSKEFEEYTTDTFPYRDFFRFIKANVALNVFQQKDNNDLYKVGNHLVKMEYEIHDKMLQHAIDLFTKIQTQYLNDQKVYFSLIPDKHQYLASKHGSLCYDFKEMESVLKKALPNMQFISIDHLLEADDYYGTDSHWRQNKVIDVAQHLASTMGKPLKDEYDVKALDHEFYGVYYGQAALSVQPDTIEYVMNDTISQLQCEGAKAIYDTEKLKGKDLYEFFLSGNQPLVKIKNPIKKDGSRLIVFRDSYACSLIPLLAESYQEIVLIDLRYMGSDLLKDHVEFNDADILFLYSATMMNSSLALK